MIANDYCIRCNAQENLLILEYKFFIKETLEQFVISNIVTIVIILISSFGDHYLCSVFLLIIIISLPNTLLPSPSPFNPHLALNTNFDGYNACRHKNILLLLFSNHFSLMMLHISTLLNINVPIRLNLLVKHSPRPSPSPNSNVRLPTQDLFRGCNF